MAIAKNTWVKAAFAAIALVLLLLLIVLAARWFRGTDAGQDFLAAYPGKGALPSWAPVGIPAWLSWQHFLNAFLLVFVVRSGLLIRNTPRPAAYWTRRNKGLFKTKNPAVRISINQWFHLAVDSLWVLNGLIFYVLLMVTGQWVRIVPTNWDVFPNALSAALQYASLQWPTESGWANYNGLQLLTYFATVFIAAPLALLTGLRMAPGLAKRFKSVEKIFPIAWARKLHLPVMIYFLVFVVVHVTLVLATGALRNLNTMYAGRDDESWIGFWIFAGSVVLMVGAWFAARPLLFRSVAGLNGSVTR